MPGKLWSKHEADEARRAAAAGVHCYSEVAESLGRTRRALVIFIRKSGFPTAQRTPGLSRQHPKLHGVWAAMKARCANPNTRWYHRYGGRGISVCQEWASFRPFIEWAKSSGYQESLTIDRIDNDGDYCPGNCRWIPLSENVSRGFSDRKRTGRSGLAINMRQACEIKGLLGSGMRQFDIADVYDITPGTVKGIAHGRSWKDAVPLFLQYAG